MKKNPIWQYDEMYQAGADHADPVRAKAYDEKMRFFRNYEKEAQEIIQLLGINGDHTVVDIGTGTGAQAITIAGICKKLYAVDVSKEMLKIAEQKALLSRLDNIEFINAGYLTYRHKGDPADFIISIAALHHLPDFWKMAAFRNMNSILKEGGILFLSDVVFSFNIDDYESELDYMIRDLEMKTDKEFAKDAVLHIKEEFSTFDWILDEMLKRSKFEILNKKISNKTNIDYIVRKIGL